jgi:hypothetical protein
MWAERRSIYKLAWTDNNQAPCPTRLIPINMSSATKNRIILGLMTFGPDEDKGARITSMDEYKRCLDLLKSRGYDEIDTARVYVGGKQEAWTRDAGWKEKGFKIASKWYPHEAGAHKPEVLKAKVDESLKELGTDSIDIYYLHAGVSDPIPSLRCANYPCDFQPIERHLSRKRSRPSTRCTRRASSRLLPFPTLPLQRYVGRLRTRTPTRTHLCVS